MSHHVSGVFGTLVIFALFGGSSARCQQRVNLDQCAEYCPNEINGQIALVCCDRVEKFGVCPSRDVATYPHSLDLSALHCCSDLDCLGSYKCCREADYDFPFSLCKRPIYPKEDEPATTESPDYEGSGEASGDDGIDSFSGSGDDIFRDDDDLIKEYPNHNEPASGSGDKEYSNVNYNRVPEVAYAKEKDDIFFDDDM